jgi:high-affinity iron transporter
MWQGFTIALREGLESFLIVALTLAYLKKTGREALARAVWTGVGVSVLVCTAAGLLLRQARNQPLWEGLLAAAAAVLVASLLVFMMRHGKTMRTELEKKLDDATADSPRSGFWGVFLFTILMITREGMETTLLIMTALFQIKSPAVFSGLAFGLLAAAAVAFSWTRLGRGVNVGVLLNVSAIFLSAFVLQLVLYAVHELSEANVLPRARSIHDATEILGPDGLVGHLMTYLLAIVPTIWLAVAWWRERLAGGNRTPAST